jgi:hypothetical protein
VASGTQVFFTAPPLVAGTYDVVLFATDGTSAVLGGGLTYLAPSGSGSPGAGGTTPGTQPGTTAPGTPPPGGTTPGTGTPPPSTGNQTPGTGQTGDGSTRVGPHGEHLRYSARLAALGTAIWRVGCSTTCSGLPV